LEGNPPQQLEVTKALAGETHTRPEPSALRGEWGVGDISEILTGNQYTVIAYSQFELGQKTYMYIMYVCMYVYVYIYIYVTNQLQEL
jgi:hypothetical protein